MQFAGGLTIDEVAAQWERDAAWVEDAIRRTLLESIPQRAGGLRIPRSAVRAERSDEKHAAAGLQGMLGWEG
jgi:hypothetical protein